MSGMESTEKIVEKLGTRSRCLDTWFSSALGLFSTNGGGLGPQMRTSADFKRYFPNNTLSNRLMILFSLV